MFESFESWEAFETIYLFRRTVRYIRTLLFGKTQKVVDNTGFFDWNGVENVSKIGERSVSLFGFKVATFGCIFGCEDGSVLP